METMMKINKNILILATALSVFSANAKEKQGVFKKAETTNSQKVMAVCTTPQASAELTVNNVRAIIFSGSDMWWDLFGSSNAWYAVPKVNDISKFVNSNFAGNVWFGGLDDGGQLKLAAQTYRQDGIDFWTGPLSTVNATTDEPICSKYDKIFRMTRKEVDEFISTGFISNAMKEWPGNGDLSLNQDKFLAPFQDVDGDEIYTPEAGDYPDYDVLNAGARNLDKTCKSRLFGDETLWWVYNDNGAVHSATGGKAIGMEVRAQAFAFKTTDEINNATFYNYQIINRSSFTLNQTYMTVWTDADLGCYQDDYIGCDVKRGLGFIYNADPMDENCGSNGYGEFIPALGCDFFQGPINTTDGVDNNGDGQIDELGEQMGMTKFLYYNNNVGAFNPPMINPDNAQQYYQYMTGFWKDGTPFTCDAANAYGGSIPTDYVFPGTTYSNSPCGPANWEETATPLDRRFLQSSGPFTLHPGAVNYVTVGLPWARTTSAGAPKASVSLLKIADDKAQALFDNCFRVLNGPEAPDMTIQELNNELVLYFSNKPNSNNYLNNYKELDVRILVDTVGTPASGTIAAVPQHYDNVDRYYHFEGFKVYQLKNESVTQEELTDAAKAKLVFNCDLANGVKRLINYEYDQVTGGDIPKVKVEGLDNGIKSTFHFTEDQFSTASDKKVVNNKTYYFFCVAYGYNQYGEYKEDQPWSQLNGACSEGQKLTYLEGRKSKKAYGIPHNPDPEKNGTISNSFYGYGPKITRIEGQGNGGNILDLTQQSVDDILNNGGRVDQITYQNGRGPVNVKVVDPLNVPNSDFALMFIRKNSYTNADTAKKYACTYNINNKVSYKNTQFNKAIGDSTTWVLKDLKSQKEYIPCKSIQIGEEFYFNELGLSVNIGQATDVGNIYVPTNGADKQVISGDFIEATMEFQNSSQVWLTGLADRDSETPFNWIRSGNYAKAANDGTQNDYLASSSLGFLDPNQVFEGVLGGTWAPYVLTASAKTNSVFAAPGYSASTAASGGATSTSQNLTNNYDIRGLASIDIVLTKDKSKWTRAIVLEECDDVASNPNGSKKLEPKRKRSVDKQGIALGDPGCNTAEAFVDSSGNGIPFQYGLSWFPGYAINQETGERLNIAFGEDSYQNNSSFAPNNGDDMMWNPTTTTSNGAGYQYSFGGRHYIYVFGHNRSTMTYTGTTGDGAALAGKTLGVGAYNKFADFAYTYKYAFALNKPNILQNIWTEAMWVNIPLLTDSRYGFSNPGDMPCDAKVRLRVKKAYKLGFSGMYSNTNSAFLAGSVVAPIVPATANASVYTLLTRDTLAGATNRNFGSYTFSTADIFSEVNNADRAKSALDLINVVPNPYYAYSTYEANRLDNRVRITNLPNVCKIKIFTLNGTLVRTFDRDVSGQEDINLLKTDFVYSKRLPYQDWDLKNQNGISVASGLYIIHVDVPGVGEKILKWFGVMRPLDLQSY